MAIERKHKGGGGFIREPGDYVVTITEVTTGLTKEKKQPMCTITFQTDDGRKIDGYYVGELKYHMAALSDLKSVCGLASRDRATDLIGRRCGIAVDPGKKRDDGSFFMKITGYGKASDVEAVPLAPPTDFAQGSAMADDQIPF